MANKIDDNSMPRVSVIIPMRNEKKHIEKCLESLLLNDYPKDRMEILAIDGMSVDGTREIIENYARKYPFVKLVDNERKTTPCAFNLGVSASEGDFIIIMGAHAVYEKDYISKCVQYSGQYGADNVGGVRVALPARETAFAKAVVQAISHPFGAGDAAYITGASSPRWVDTVFGGCYKREVFEKIGLFNENLTRSQDMEFNLRLRKAGGKILLAPDIVCYYYPRAEIGLWSFWKRNLLNGFWATYPLKFGSPLFRLRHLIPLGFVVLLAGLGALSFFLPLALWTLPGVVGLYALVSVAASATIAVRERNPAYMVFMPLVFGLLHFGYGLGSLWGLIRALISREFWHRLLSGKGGK